MRDKMNILLYYTYTYNSIQYIVYMYMYIGSKWASV